MKETFGRSAQGSFHVSEFTQSKKYNEFMTWKRGDNFDTFMHENPYMLVIFDVDDEMFHIVQANHLEHWQVSRLVKVSGHITQEVLDRFRDVEMLQLINCELEEEMVVEKMQMQIRTRGCFGFGSIHRLRPDIE